jgi:hypothetical protein
MTLKQKILVFMMGFLSLHLTNTSAQKMTPICEANIGLDRLDELNRKIPDPNYCEQTRLEIRSNGNLAVLEIEDRYISLEPSTLNFPYKIVKSQSGGSSCCTHYYLIDSNGVSMKIPNASDTFELRRTESDWIFKTYGHAIQIKNPQ